MPIRYRYCFSRFQPCYRVLEAIGARSQPYNPIGVSIGTDADLTIKSYRHQVPTATKYPRLTSSSRQFFLFLYCHHCHYLYLLLHSKKFCCIRRAARPTIKLDGDFKNTNNQRLKKKKCLWLTLLDEKNTSL
jgi:hypothetical protein